MFFITIFFQVNQQEMDILNSKDCKVLLIIGEVNLGSEKKQEGESLSISFPLD